MFEILSASLDVRRLWDAKPYLYRHFLTEKYHASMSQDQHGLQKKFVCARGLQCVPDRL